MGEIIVGVFAVLIGALFALQGGNFMRILFPIFGFVAGFSGGAALVTGITGDGFLSTALSWFVGFFVALLFAVLAYYFYAFAVVLAFAGLGFTFTATILTALNMDWSWLIILLGTAVAVGFALFAVAGRLPMTLLIVATSFFGVAMAIYGLMLVLNVADFGDFSSGQVYQVIRTHAGLYILWLTLGIGASIAQLKVLDEQTKLAQEYWNNSKTFNDLVADGSSPKKSAK